jgi:hypothetical protein
MRDLILAGTGGWLLCEPNCLCGEVISGLWLQIVGTPPINYRFIDIHCPASLINVCAIKVAVIVINS